VIKGIHVVKKPRKGKPPFWYVYATRGGPCIYRHEGRERPTLDATALRKLIAAHDAQIELKRPETLATLIDEWRGSPEWKRLAASTKKTWGAALDAIETKWGDIPLGVWSEPRMTRKILEWRDTRADKPRAADLGVQVLRALLKYGRLRGRVAINAADGIPQLYRGGNRAEIIWTDADLEAFGAASADLGREYVFDGARLASLTGLRRDDLISLTWDEISDAAIIKRAAKISRGKRRTVTVPRLPELDVLLKELRARSRKEGVRTVLVNSRGRPWSGDAFTHALSEVRDRVGIFHTGDDGVRRDKHIHDLRGTFCTKLIKAGLEDQEVAEVMGWSPEQVRGIRRSYVDRNEIVKAIGERLRRAMEPDAVAPDNLEEEIGAGSLPC
jgi:integrase